MARESYFSRVPIGARLDELSMVGARTRHVGKAQINTNRISTGAVTGLEILQVTDLSGESTTSSTPVQISGFSADLTLDATASILVLMRLNAAASDSVSSGIGRTRSRFYLYKDGSEVRRATLAVAQVDTSPRELQCTAAVNHAEELAAGTYTFAGYFSGGDPVNSEAICYDRELIVMVFKR